MRGGGRPGVRHVRGYPSRGRMAMAPRAGPGHADRQCEATVVGILRGDMSPIHAFLGTATLVAAIALVAVAGLSWLRARRGGRGLPTVVSVVAGTAAVLALSSFLLGPLVVALGFNVASPLHYLLAVAAVAVVPAAAAPGLLVVVHNDGDVLRRRAALDGWLIVGGVALAAIGLLLRVTG